MQDMPTVKLPTIRLPPKLQQPTDTSVPAAARAPRNASFQAPGKAQTEVGARTSLHLESGCSLTATAKHQACSAIPHSRPCSSHANETLGVILQDKIVLGSGSQEETSDLPVQAGNPGQVHSPFNQAIRRIACASSSVPPAQRAVTDASASLPLLKLEAVQGMLARHAASAPQQEISQGKAVTSTFHPLLARGQLQEQRQQHASPFAAGVPVSASQGEDVLGAIPAMDDKTSDDRCLQWQGNLLDSAPHHVRLHLPVGHISWTSCLRAPAGHSSWTQ